MTDEKTNLENAVKKEILIVDDKRDVRMMCEDILTAGYSVRTATDGEDAMKKIDEKLPHLVITDMEMPCENDGLNLIKKIKENDKYKDIKIIAMSSNLEEYKSRLLEYIEEGDMLAKPFGIVIKDIVKRKLYNSL